MVAKGLDPFRGYAARASEERIEMFMQEGLIPLAVQTNAFVICTAEKGCCILSQSFNRMLQVKTKATSSTSSSPAFTKNSSSICSNSLTLKI